MAPVPPVRAATGFCSSPRRLKAAACGLLLLLAGCPAKKQSEEAPPRRQKQSAGAFAGTDPWRLTTTDPDAPRGNRGIFLGNGYLGATFGANGGAGPSSACTVAGLYDENENLASLPLWNKLDLPAAPTKGAYSQTLDMKRGVLVTKMGEVEVTSFVSRDNPHLAVLHVEGAPMPRPPERIRHRTPGIEVTQQPDPSGNGWTRFVVISPEPAPSRSAPVFSYADALAAHVAAWAKLWERNIVIEGDPEAQQLVHALMFHLLQSVRAGGADSIPPETWSGDFYKGHIFWDADVWIFPALLAQHPDLARCILDYRFRHLGEARRRARAAGYAGADFPWESAATGREVAPGGFRTGRHVTAGVGWAHWKYWRATGDKKWLRERGWPVLSGVADYFASRATKNPATGAFDLRGVFGPDELRGTVDNNTYTNAMARYCLHAATAAAKIVGARADPRWAEVAERIALPDDEANDRFLARENDRGEPTKQADGELVLYPAELPMQKTTAANTFDFHAARPIKSGPAMTASIHALIAARLGRGADAERFFRDSYRPFVRGPFLLFSEKRSLDRCYFATGAGGVLQSVLYGFGGLDWEAPERLPGALPPSWKRLTITGIQRGGKSITLTVTNETGGAKIRDLRPAR